MAADTLIMIPAFNEARRLAEVLTAIGRVAPEADVLVVDDGSGDGTAEVARGQGVNVVVHPFNLGYGAALQTGYRFAERAGYRHLIQLDADGQHDPASIATVLVPLAAGADLVLGSRFRSAESYSPPWTRRIGIRLFSRLASLAVGQRLTDVTTGFQGLSPALVRLHAESRSFPADYPDANMIVRAARAGLVIQEVPVAMRANPEGGTLHVGLRPVLYVLKMLLAVLLEASRFRRSRRG